MLSSNDRREQPAVIDHRLVTVTSSWRYGDGLRLFDIMGSRRKEEARKGRVYTYDDYMAFLNLVGPAIRRAHVTRLDGKIQAPPNTNDQTWEAEVPLAPQGDNHGS